MSSKQVIEDPIELGKRIAAARGYAGLQRPEFAVRLGISVPTLRRWESGDVSALGRSEAARRDKANRAIAAAECPDEIVGVVSFRLEERIAKLEEQVSALGGMALEPIGRDGDASDGAARRRRETAALA